MLKKCIVPSSNNSENVVLIVKGAKRRRNYAHSSVKAVNSGLGERPVLTNIK